MSIHVSAQMSIHMSTHTCQHTCARAPRGLHRGRSCVPPCLHRRRYRTRPSVAFFLTGISRAKPTANNEWFEAESDKYRSTKQNCLDNDMSGFSFLNVGAKRPSALAVGVLRAVTTRGNCAGRRKKKDPRSGGRDLPALDLAHPIMLLRMCIDMCIDMCIGMCTGRCIDVRMYRHVHRHVYRRADV